MSQKSFMIGVPTYDGKIDLQGSFRLLEQSSERKGKTLIFTSQHSSLLAFCFNSLWATALNYQLDNIKIDRFGMCHSDIVPQANWIDVADDEMERVGADVLSVCVPIKDDRGFHSVGIDDPENPWASRRLTSNEIMRLPETFCNKDIGFPNHALIVNTGLWICKFDQEWRFPPFCFTINDRIHKKDNGRFEAQVSPEDWNASRYFHSLGLKVFATRKVQCLHEGRFMFDNQKLFGRYTYDKDIGADGPLSILSKGLVG